MTWVDRAVVGMDPRKRSVTVGVMAWFSRSADRTRGSWVAAGLAPTGSATKVAVPAVWSTGARVPETHAHGTQYLPGATFGPCR